MSRPLAVSRDWTDWYIGRLCRRHQRTTDDQLLDLGIEESDLITDILINTQLIEIHWITPGGFILDIIGPDVKAPWFEMLQMSVD
jgi:hypothetical protein